MVAWVAAVYHTHDAEQWVEEGPAAFQVRLDDGRALLVRKRTGEYWAMSGATDLHRVSSDRRLRRAVSTSFFDTDSATGVVHDPAHDLSWEQVHAWLAAHRGERVIGQVIDRGWAFLATQGPIQYGGVTGHPVATFVVVKRTGEVWDLAAGPQAEAAYHARTEAGFRAQLAYVTAYREPIARIPR